MQPSRPSGCVVPILQMEESCHELNDCITVTTELHVEVRPSLEYAWKQNCWVYQVQPNSPAKSSTIIRPTFKLSSFPLQYIPICYKKQVYFYFRYPLLSAHLPLQTPPTKEHKFCHVICFRFKGQCDHTHTIFSVHKNLSP